MEGTFENHLNGKLFYETLAQITVTVRPKGQAAGDQNKESA